MVYRAAFLLLFLMFQSALVFSQSRIFGRVVDHQQVSLPGAHITIDGSFSGTSSDETGRFSIQVSRSGPYLLKVRFMGFIPSEHRFDKLPEQELLVVLEPENYLSDEVIVAATRMGDRSNSSTTLIGRKELEVRNVGQDIPLLLALSPSLVASSDAGNGVGYSGFRIRGTDMNRINITVNGVSLNDGESHGVWWVNMPDFASSVQDVQITRGVGTSTHGAAAFGASLNFQTQAVSSKPFLQVESSAGSFGTFRNAISVGTGILPGNFSVDLRLSDVQSDGYIRRASSRLQSLYFSLGKQSEKNNLRLLVFSGREKTGLAWDGVPSSLLEADRRFNGLGAYTDQNGVLRYYDNQSDNYRQDHFQFIFSRKLGARWKSNVTLHFTHGAGYYEEYREGESFDKYRLSPIQVGSDSIILQIMGIREGYFEDGLITHSDFVRRKHLSNDYYGLNGSLHYQNPKVASVFGGSLTHYFGNHFGRIIWSGYGGLPKVNYEWYRNQGDKKELNLFGKVEKPLFGQGLLFADVQVRQIEYQISGLDDDFRNISQLHSFLFINPKSGFRWDFNDNHLLTVFLGMSHREPNRDNFTDARPGQRAPKTELLRNLEAGYQAVTNDWAFSMNFFWMNYWNQLILTGRINDVGAPVMENVPRSYRVGFEMGGKVHFLKSLSWEGNLSWSQNRIRDFVEYVDNWDTWMQDSFLIGTTHLAFSPEWIGNSTIFYSGIQGLAFFLESQYVGSQFIDNTASKERMLDSWLVHNLRTTWKPRIKGMRNFSLNLSLHNLLNHSYESNAWVYRYFEGGEARQMDGYFPQAGFHVMIGFKIEI